MITVAFSQNKKILSRIIRLLTHSDVSHALIIVKYYGEYMAFHASGLSVGYVNLREFAEHGSKLMYSVDIPLDEMKEGRIKKRCARLCGKNYGWATLFGYGLVLLAKSIGIRIKNPWADGKHTYICTELIGELLGIADAENMTPDELMNKIRSIYERPHPAGTAA